MTDAPSAAYAICLDCGIEHLDRDAMSEHGNATLAPTGELGITARGHRSQVVNPTPQEQARSRARRAIDDAHEQAFDTLDQAIRAGLATEEDITKELSLYPDLADEWADWRAEATR